VSPAAAVFEFLCAELPEVSGTACRKRKLGQHEGCVISLDGHDVCGSLSDAAMH
jgi:hypothetical protein